MKPILLLLTLLAASFTPVLPQQITAKDIDTEPDFIFIQEIGMWRALQSHNLGAFESMLLPDYIEVEKTIQTRDQLMANLNTCTIVSFKLRNHQTRILSSDAAVIAYSGSSEITCGESHLASNYNATTSLAVGTNQYTDIDSQDQKLPNVPGKATGTGVIAFSVDNKFDLAKAVMTVGSGQFNQAVIPLGQSGKLVSLAPIKVAITGSLVLPMLYKLDVTGGDLSYDNPLNHQEEDAGSQLLVVHFSRTALVDTCCISAGQFSLKLPDGTAAAADRVEECCGIGTAGTTKPDQFVTFVFKKADGSYDLMAKEKVNDAQEQADVPFTITNSSGGGSASPGSGSGSGGGASPSPSGH